MVSASIAELQTNPVLTGVGTGRVIDSGESVEVYDRALPRLEADRRVAMLTGLHVVFGISTRRSQEETAFAYDIRRGDPGISVVRGKIARQPDEVALGPATMENFGKDVGDRIELRSESGAASFRVVGSVLFPEGDFKHDTGLALTTSGADRLVSDVHDVGAIHQVLFDWADGVDDHNADRQLEATGLQVLTNKDALQPASVTNLGQVTTLPRYLAGFLGVLSLAALGLALFVSFRRRVRELATLRVLGMTSWSGAAVIGSQGLAIVTIAVIVGAPVGIALGTRIWTPIAEGANVVVQSVTPGSWIAGYLLVTVIAAGALTATPAWRALRLRAANALRSE
jgi:predicted lysophospholipase L1 biosynthesis ABC-type transport system permease subunit